MYRVTKPFRVFVPDTVYLSEVYIGTGQAYGSIFELETLEAGTLVHDIPLGTFVVSEDGVFPAYHSRPTTPLLDFSSKEQDLWPLDRLEEVTPPDPIPDCCFSHDIYVTEEPDSDLKIGQSIDYVRCSASELEEKEGRAYPAGQVPK